MEQITQEYIELLKEKIKRLEQELQIYKLKEVFPPAEIPAYPMYPTYPYYYKYKPVTEEWFTGAPTIISIGQ